MQESPHVQSTVSGARDRSGPLVSIGMPVYNGENFLRFALESVLSQTYGNLEILIADNASTDATEAICREFAQRDSRIRYHRHPENLGASDNHDYVFFNTSGPYFKIVAHDDVIEPTFVERCVEKLEANPDAALAFARIQHIDETGKRKELIDEHLGNMDHPDPAVRLGRLLGRVNYAATVFGVIRRDRVKAETILGRYTGSDRTFLAELALAGPWVRVDEILFLRRNHASNSSKAFPQDSDRIRWFDTKASTGRTFPTWRRLLELIKVIRRADLTPPRRVRAYAQLGRWLITPWYRPHLLMLLRDPIAVVKGSVAARTRS